jgi:2,3-dimethylmalate lyase
MHRSKSFKDLIDTKRLLAVPGVFDALTARVAQYCGFSAIFMTGYGTAAAYGFPDFGLLTMSEMLENVRRIVHAVDIPLIADADTGYGNPINVYRTFREFEKAGAAAIQLEDQAWPKRCGHMEGKQVIDAEEMVGKIKAAVDARVHSDTVLIVRTDSIATDGFEEAIRRAGLYAEAGADVLFVEAPDNGQMSLIPSLIPRPCLINMAFSDQSFSVNDLEEMGYSIAIYPTVTLFGAIEGCMRTCESLITNGKEGNSKDMPFDFEQLNHFLGIGKYRELETKFASNNHHKRRER